MGESTYWLPLNRKCGTDVDSQDVYILLMRLFYEPPVKHRHTHISDTNCFAVSQLL